MSTPVDAVTWRHLANAGELRPVSSYHRPRVLDRVVISHRPGGAVGPVHYAETEIYPLRTAVEIARNLAQTWAEAAKADDLLRSLASMKID